MSNSSFWMRHSNGTYKKVSEQFAARSGNHPSFRVKQRPADWRPPESLRTEVSTKDFMGNLFRRESNRRDEATIQSPALTCRLTLNQQGLIVKKVEQFPTGHEDTYQYAYDKQDRLKRVRLNGELLESYTYNGYGARIAETVSGRGERHFEYTDGKLTKAGAADYEYANDGSLVKRTTPAGTMYFDYGRDNGLNRAVVPGPAVFEYRTGQHGLPLEKRFNNAIMERTHWHDMFRVDTWDDFENRIGIVFHYGNERMPTA